jgi:hypothetical protein
MSSQNSVKIEGGVSDSTIINGGKVSVRIVGSKRSKAAQTYPAGSIGTQLDMRNYVRYLSERYNRHRQADKSFGQVRPFSYAVLFKNIENTFKAPLYFIPQHRFSELVDYLHTKIDGTILGRRNRARGIKNYASWDEFQLEQGNEPRDMRAG